jgi:hypothetical protein
LLPEQIEELVSLHEMLKERYAIIIDIFKNVDDQRIEVLFNGLSLFVRKTREIRKNQIKRIKNHQVGTRYSVVFLNHLGELRNLALFANRIVRVFDELILNPVEESEFIPSNIKKELKEMRREAKSMSALEVEIMMEDEVTSSASQTEETGEEPDVEPGKTKKKDPDHDDLKGN